MTYTIESCPYCGTKIRSYSSLSEPMVKSTSGCPFVKCSRCGLYYYDSTVSEPGETKYKKSNFFSMLAGSIFLAVIASIMVTFTVGYFFRNSERDLEILALSAFSIALVICMIIQYKNKDDDDDQAYKTWMESKKRLENKEYSKIYYDAKCGKKYDYKKLALILDGFANNDFCSSKNDSHPYSAETEKKVPQSSPMKPVPESRQNESNKEKKMVLPHYMPGFEPDEVKPFVSSFFTSLEEIYPDKIINVSTWNHKKFDNAAGMLCKYLGYANGTDFLEAYGYKVVKS